MLQERSLGWPNLNGNRFRNKITCCKKQVNVLYLTKVECDEATGREAPKPRRLRLDLRTTTEPQVGTNPHNTAWSNGSRTTRSRGSQRDLFTIPRRTRKNKGVQGTQHRGCDQLYVVDNS
jgi:hypothetical protein